MTLWRLSGLIWMGLVAAGLVLIVLRVILRRNSIWLLNANLITTYITLLACSVLDFSTVTANWNAARAVQHLSSTAPYQTLDVDISYLECIGPPALPALQKLLVITNANKNLKINYQPAWEEILSTHNRIAYELQNTQSRAVPG